MGSKKVALVTGGSQGIGKAVALEFAKNGYLVVICARTKGDVEKAASEISGMGYECSGRVLDVSDAKAVARVVGEVAVEHGRIDVLVAGAGVYGPIGPIEENDSRLWEQAIRINLCGTAYCVQAVAPIMRRQGGGCIITFAGGGVGGANIKPNISAYVSSKFAIAGFTEAMANELRGSNIRINAISPGAVNTRLLDQVLASGEKAGADFLAAAKKQKEAGGTPPEVAAKMAAFLASDSARHISGKVLSAVWDKPESLVALGEKLLGSLYTLRRIDEAMFFEKRKGSA